MAEKELKLGLPEDAAGKQKALIVAAVVVVIAVTPTLFDGYDAWVNHPRVRPALIGWYGFSLFVVLNAWRVFVNQ